MPEIKANTTLTGIKQSNNQQCKFTIFWYSENKLSAIQRLKKNLSITDLWGNASQVALVIKNPFVNTGDTRDAGPILGLGRSPGEGQGTPLQYSCLENPMDRGAWWATVQRVAKSRTWLKCLPLLDCVSNCVSVCQKERRGDKNWQNNGQIFSKFY